MTRIVVTCLSLAFLVACSAPTTRPALGGDPEAERIYTQLASAGFLPEEPPPPGATGLSINWSRVWYALRELAGAVGDEERQDARENLSQALATTGYSSQVCFRTPDPGAKIFVQSISSRRAVPVGYTNSNESKELTLGLYNIWAVRSGVTTDSRENQPILKRETRVDLEGDSSGRNSCSG